MPAGKDRPHNITPTFMRRLYARILAFSCKLEWNEQRKGWIATWGSSQTKTPNHSAPVDDSLFTGVDFNGRTLETNKTART